MALTETHLVYDKDREQISKGLLGIERRDVDEVFEALDKKSIQEEAHSFQETLHRKVQLGLLPATVLYSIQAFASELGEMGPVYLSGIFMADNLTSRKTVIGKSAPTELWITHLMQRRPLGGSMNTVTEKVANSYFKNAQEDLEDLKFIEPAFGHGIWRFGQNNVFNRYVYAGAYDWYSLAALSANAENIHVLESAPISRKLKAK